MEQGINHVGVSLVTICHDGQGNYLLGLRSKKCRDEQLCWDLIGSGGLEFGETFEQSIKREVVEECGAKVSQIELLGYREVHRVHEGRQTHWIAFDFKVLINPEEVKIGEPEKCLELRWSKLKDFPDKLHSQLPLFLDKYKDRLL